MDIKEILGSHEKNAKEHIEFFLNLSTQYYKKSGLDISMFADAKASLPPDFFLVESVHQPNFLPSLNYFAKILVGSRLAENKNVVFFHGFLDTDTTSERWSAANILPFISKQGYLPFGFPSLKGIKKPFSLIDKPSEKDFEAMIGSIDKAYSSKMLKAAKDKGLETSKNKLVDALRRSYERAENFGQLNSFMCSSILGEILGVYPFYYLFSDITGSSEFYPHFLYFFDNCETINKEISLLNKSQKPGLNIVQLWFHCDCGNKLKIVKKGDDNFISTCDKCGIGYTIGKKFIKKNLSRFSVNYLTRALLVSQILGTDAYIAGKGSVDPAFGQYEITLQHAAKKLNLNFYDLLVLNVNFGYKSVIYQNYIDELALHGFDIKNIASEAKKAENQISFCRQRLLNSDSQEKKELSKELSKLNSQLTFLRFNELGRIKPSFIDLILTFGSSRAKTIISELLSHYTLSRNSENITCLTIENNVA